MQQVRRGRNKGKIPKKRATYYIDANILDAINTLPRSIVPNKSMLVEQLLTEWLNKERHKAAPQHP